MYVIVPNGPMAVLRGYFAERVEAANNALAQARTAAPTGTGRTLASAKRVNFEPALPLRWFLTSDKLILKAPHRGREHITISLRPEKVEVHRTDEAAKAAGLPWWQHLAEVTPDTLQENASKAQEAIRRLVLQRCRYVAAESENRFGFVVTYHSELLGDSPPIHLSDSGRTARVDVPAMLGNYRFELVDSLSVEPGHHLWGQYMHLVGDTLYTSESGIIYPVPNKDTGRWRDFVFLPSDSYREVLETVARGLLGLLDTDINLFG